MKLLTLITFSMALFTISAYRAETVSTFCFFITSGCYKDHAAEVLAAINKHTDYISHSTVLTKSGMMTSIIIYK